MHNLVVMFLNDPGELEKSIHEVRENVPCCLTADCERPDKDQAVKEYKSRFLKYIRT